MRAERREPEAHLEIGRGQEAEPEHGERGDEQVGELGKIAVDLRGVAGDRIGIGRGVRAGRPDLALDARASADLRDPAHRRDG